MKTHDEWLLNRKRLGLKLRVLRRSKQMTQDELGVKIGTSRQTINTLEKGRTLPKVETIEDLSIKIGDFSIIPIYSTLQDDVNSLYYLAEKIYVYNLSTAQLLIKNIIKKKQISDVEELVTLTVQSMIWDLEVKQKTNRRKIQYIVNAFDDLKQETFIDMLNKIYETCFNQDKKFDAFTKICEGIIKDIPVENEKSFTLWYQYANALYYQKNFVESVIALNRSLENCTPHIPISKQFKVYSRYGLINLQLEAYEKARHAFETCEEMASNQIERNYCLMNIARSYFMQEEYANAFYYWGLFLKETDEKELLRINVFNDMAMAYIKLEKYSEARDMVKRNKHLLKLAKEMNWHMYKNEKLLRDRNMAALNLISAQYGNDKEATLKNLRSILDRLEESYLKDEYQLTKNWLLNLLL